MLDLRFTRHRSQLRLGVLAVTATVNFFAHRFLPDARWLLFATLAVLFGDGGECPLVLGLGMVAPFIWLAENVEMFTQAWVVSASGSAFDAGRPGQKLGA